MKGILKLEIEKHQSSHNDLEHNSECGSVNNGAVNYNDQGTGSSLARCPSSASDWPHTGSAQWSTSDGKGAVRDMPNGQGNPSTSFNDVRPTYTFDNFALHLTSYRTNSFPTIL